MRDTAGGSAATEPLVFRSGGNGRETMPAPDLPSARADTYNRFPATPAQCTAGGGVATEPFIFGVTAADGRQILRRIGAARMRSVTRGYGMERSGTAQSRLQKKLRALKKEKRT